MIFTKTDADKISAAKLVPSDTEVSAAIDSFLRSQYNRTEKYPLEFAPGNLTFKSYSGNVVRDVLARLYASNWIVTMTDTPIFRLYPLDWIGDITGSQLFATTPQ